MIKLVLRFTVALLVSIVAIILFASKMDSCSVKKTENVVAKVDVSGMHDKIVDSLKTIETKHLIVYKDSLIAVYSSKLSADRMTINNQKLQITDLKKTNDNLVDKYNLNPTLAKCDSLVNNQTKIINTQDQQIDSLDSEAECYSRIVYELRTKSSLQDSLVIAKQLYLDRANNSINILKTELKKKDNWWRRNEKWIFFGAGIIGTGLVLK